MDICPWKASVDQQGISVDTMSFVGVIKCVFTKLLLGILQIGERWLQIEDALDKADVIVVLAGGNGGREIHAAELYHKGYAPIVAITWTTINVLGHTIYGAKLMRHNMRQAGVSDGAIWLLPGHVKSTHEEARSFATFAQTQGWQKVIVVTDAYHTRRAAMTFRQTLRHLSIQVMVSSCGRTLTTRDDWLIEHKLFNLLFEYLKLLYYFARRRLARY